MPPINDNFANAIVLDGVGGDNTDPAQLRSNIGATTQPGEPGNGKSVWFKWRVPNTFDNAAISTLWRGPWAAGLVRTFVRVYDVGAGTGLSSLIEVAYMTPWNSKYANWDMGSYVAWNSQGRTFYIQVSGLGDEEGLFPLTWGKYEPLRLGKCDPCSVSFVTGVDCSSAYQMQPPVQNIPGPQQFSFADDIPAGTYFVAWCKGSWSNVGGEGNWSVDLLPPSDFGANGVDGVRWLNFFYNHIDLGVQIRTFNHRRASTPADFLSPDAMENFMQCAATDLMYHAGGPLGMNFFDNATGDNVGSANGRPVYALMKVSPVLELTRAAGTWLTATRVRCAFTIQNKTVFPWGDDPRPVHVTLEQSGGIINPTAAQLKVLGLATAVVSMDFDTTPAGNTDIVATLKLNDGLNAYPDLSIHLTPVLTISKEIVGGAFCAAVAKKKVSVIVKNSGYLDTNALHLAFVLSSGDHPRDVGCVDLAGAFLNYGHVGNNSGTKALSVLVPTYCSPTGLALTVTPTDGPVVDPDTILDVSANAGDVASAEFSFQFIVTPFPNSRLIVSFTDASRGTVVAWAWQFGDGAVSAQQSPSHQYGSLRPPSGTQFIVTLQVTDLCGRISTMQHVLIAP